jgi:hypothetical protein
MRTPALLLLAVAGCATADPCDGHSGTCVALRIEDGGGVGAVDQLAIRVSGAGQLDGRTPSQPGKAVPLPVVTALYLPAAGGRAAVTVDGRRGGSVVGQGAGALVVGPGVHGMLTVTLAPMGAGGDLGSTLDAGVPADLAVADQSITDQGTLDLAGADLSGPKRYVFLLPKRSTVLGSQAALDAQCHDAGKSAGLPGEHRAVIAYPGVNPKDVLTLNEGKLIALPDGTIVATDSSFFAMSHLAPINELATGKSVGSGCVFTDFTFGGDRFSSTEGDCVGWTSSDASHVAYVGEVSAQDSHWSFTGTPPACKLLECYIYCIESNTL